MNENELDDLIKEATIDAYDEQEQRTGFFTMLGDNLVFPFPASIIGEKVLVCGVDMKDEERILAKIEKKGREYLVDVLDLMIDAKKVKGSEWIAAYRRWGNYV